MPENNQTTETRMQLAAIFATLFIWVGIELIPQIFELDPLDSRQWEFRTDMNGDGLLTIRDVGGIARWLLFYPGDLLLYFIQHHSLWISRTMAGVTDFLEISPVSYGGLFSFLVSLVAWPLGGWVTYGPLYWMLTKAGIPANVYKEHRSNRG